MQISTKAWMEYIRKMRAISDEAANKMQRYIQLNGFGDDKALLDYAYALATHYGEAIGALSATMYEATAAAQNVIIAPAQIAEPPEYGEVAKIIHGAKKQSEKNVPRAMHRIIKQVGADTTRKNVARDGAQFAWVPQGDTCAFCIALASRGWQYEDPKNKNPRAEHIHANCDCQYAVRFDGKSSVDGYDPDVYKKIYEDAEGKNPNEKIKFIRRQFYGQNKIEMKMRTCGAYTYQNDPNGKKRERIAEDYYEEIRHRKKSYEIDAVARNSGMSPEDVGKVFEHVFIREHKYENGRIGRFYADYYMAHSWMRLREGKNIQKHDLTMLKHELEEEKIMGKSLDIIYEIAHNEVQKKYNYAKELMEYLKDHNA